MKEIWILVLLILSAALPAIIVFFIFRANNLRGKNPVVTLPQYLLSLSAGLISVLIAALIQSRLGRLGSGVSDGPEFVFFGILVRIALVEEASRIVTLIPLIKIIQHRQDTDSSFGAALGLGAALGFALLENALYGLSDISITLLRAFTAAPLHSACGIRAGAAIYIMTRHPVRALFLFVSAVFIHGAYNIFILIPGLPSFLAVPTAFIALFASLYLLKSHDINDGNTFIHD